MLSAETEFRIGKPYRRTTTLYVYFHKGFRGGERTGGFEGRRISKKNKYERGETPDVTHIRCNDPTRTRIPRSTMHCCRRG